MTRMLRRAVTVLSLAGLVACQTVSDTPEASAINDWLPDLRQADVVIVGETHDNAAHHQLQAEIIDALKPFAVVFEMVPASLTDRANQTVAASGDLRVALDWDNSGWPDWEIYKPVFEASHDARIVGAGVDRVDIGRAMTDGAQSVSGLPDAYGLATPLPDDQAAEITAEMVESHCGMIPESVARQMVDAQRLRDAAFAAATVQAMNDAKGAGPIVLIAGTGHARRDRGVPAYLARVIPDATVRVVGLIEDGTATEPGHYDITHATPAAERDDPCDGISSSMKKD